MSNEQAASPSVWRSLWGWVWPIVVGVAVAKALMTWVVSFAEVPTGSMYPTIPVNPPQVPNPAYIIVDHLATEFHAPYRGEVVLFPWPDDPSKVFVKRIIGLPGETVRVHGGHVYIDNQILKEPYLTTSYGQTLGDYGPFKIVDRLDAPYYLMHYVGARRIL